MSSKNVIRRNITPSQKAMIGVDVIAIYRDIKLDPPEIALRLGGEVGKRAVPSQDGGKFGEKALSERRVGEKMGVSHRTEARVEGSPEGHPRPSGCGLQGSCGDVTRDEGRA